MNVLPPFPRLVLVGAVSKDEMVYEGQTHTLWGGAVVYGSIAAARSGVSVRVVTKTAESDIPQLNWYREDNIPVTFLASERSTSIRNIYHTQDREQRTCVPLSMADPLTPEDIANLDGDIYYAAALIQGEIPHTTLKAMADAGPLAMDVQGFIRAIQGEELILEPWPDQEEALALATYVKADGAEAKVVTGLAQPEDAARAIQEKGPREVVITHGRSVTLALKGKVITRPLTPRNMDGRTGRGDTLFSSYLARRLLGQPPVQALEFAAALTSIKMETPGPFLGQVREVEQRMTSDPGLICSPSHEVTNGKPSQSWGLSEPGI